MVARNNVVAKNRFRKFGKNWGRLIRTWFDQPAKKAARRNARARLASAIAPRPLGRLRPVVRPGGRKHNLRVREGRGFTVQEIRKVGLNARLARSLGIAVDRRRKNRSEESLQANVQRLKQYQAKLVLWPKKYSKNSYRHKTVKKAAPSASVEERKNATQFRGRLFPIVGRPPVAQETRVIRPEELLPKNSQFVRLRRARADARLAGRRKRRAEIRAKKAELAAAGGGKKAQVIDEE